MQSGRMSKHYKNKKPYRLRLIHLSESIGNQAIHGLRSEKEHFAKLSSSVLWTFLWVREGEANAFIFSLCFANLHL